MKKQSASLDTSFWINAFKVGILHESTKFYKLKVAPAVKEEIESVLGEVYIPGDALLFQSFLDSGKVQVEKPRKAIKNLGKGQGQAIALALEKGYTLLTDDAFPFSYAKEKGLRVVTVPAFLLLLCSKGIFTKKKATVKLRNLKGLISAEILQEAQELLRKISAKT